MASTPQPDIFIKYSKELLKAKMKVRIGGVQNQVWEAIMFLTYGQLPPVKEIVYSGKAIAELTGLSRRYIYKAKKELLKMGMINVTKKGDNLSEVVGINKYYNKWKVSPKKVTHGLNPLNTRVRDKMSPKKVTNIIKIASPKKVTNVTKKGDAKKSLPIREKKEEIKKRNKRKNQPKKTSPLRSYQYPNWLDKNLWKEFADMRAKSRHPITSETGITRLLNSLKKIMDDGHDQEEVIGLALERNWRGFFAPSENDNTGRMSETEKKRREKICQKLGMT